MDKAGRTKKIIFNKRLHFNSAPSTHLYAKKNLELLEDGTVITADHQTSGKGRGTRCWTSPPGKSLLSTIVLKRIILPETAGPMTLVVALTVSQVLDGYEIHSKIKWPNDVVVGGKKIAGILAESIVEKGFISSLIISLGLNLTQDKKDMEQIDKPATSLFLESSIKIDANIILESYLKKLSENLDIFFKKGFDSLIPLIRQKAELVGKKIRLNTAGEVINCKVLDYADDGAIVVEEDSGFVKRFFAGEVEQTINKGAT